MAKRDYYDVLGLGRSASEAELKNAFRPMAKQHHPDRNPGDKSCRGQFKEINEAYEVLRDPQKKAAYDQFGHQAFEQGRGGARWRAGAGFDFTSFADVFDDLFGDFMGNSGQRRGRAGGARGRRPSLQSDDLARGGVRRQARADPRADDGGLRGLRRLRQRGRQRARGLPRPVAVRAGCAASRVSSPSSAPA